MYVNVFTYKMKINIENYKKFVGVGVGVGFVGIVTLKIQAIQNK